MSDEASVPQRRYEHALHGITPGWWRGAAAIVILLVLFFGISTVLGGLALALDVLGGAITPQQLASGVVPITPLVLLSTNLSAAAMIPIAAVLQWTFFGVRPRFLSSVQGRLRWRWLGRLSLVIVPVWIVYVGASTLLGPPGEFRVDATALALIAVVILTTPLQAAGEEYGLRGLVQRSVGSWFARPRTALIVATVFSAGVFGSAHFATDPWLIAYYVTFGVALSLAAHFTGGLEAPVLIHAVNNVLLLVPAALLGQLGQGIDRSAGAGGPIILVPMAVVLLGAYLSARSARRRGIRVVAPAPPSHYDAAPVR